MGALARVFGTLVLVLCGSLANGPASAGHHAHMHGHVHGHGPIVRFGFSYGFPIHAPHHFPAPVYAIPGYVFPAPVYVYSPPAIRYYPSPGYVERSVPLAESTPPQAKRDWYYCADSRMYYPSARECAGGWLRVPAQPSSR